VTIRPRELRERLRRSRKKIVLAMIAAWAIALTTRIGIGFVMLMTGVACALLLWSAQSSGGSSGGSGDGSDGGSWWSSGSDGAGDSSDGGGSDGGGGDGGD